MIDLEPLFTPFPMGGIMLPNRFVLPGMQRGWCEDGAPTPKLIDYYRRRIEGGVGLAISESLAVDHPSATRNPMFARLTERTLPAWQTCVSAVKQAGGHILMQLWHEGALRPEEADDEWAAYPTLSPSGLAHVGRANGRAATTAELGEIRDAFVRSALLAQAAGADGVEVHGAHGYLLDQFLWAGTNRREDGYGGDDIRDRVRFPAEIVAAIRAACGPDFVITFRFSQWKEADFSARVAETPDELEAMLDPLADAGLNALHASTRRFWEPEWPGSPLNLAGWARRLSGLPVITVGSVGLSSDVMDSFFGKPVVARVEQGLADLTERFAAEEFDLVSVGRSLISDADWVRKVRAGDYASIRVFDRDHLGMPDMEGSIVAEAHKVG